MGYQLLLISLSSLLIGTLIFPLAWHIKCRNVPALILIMWLFISSIKILVDASIWGGENFSDQWDGKVWCDIMVKIQQGTDSGVVCAITAILLNLYLILCANDWTVAWFLSPMRKCIIELCICLITPAFVMGVNYVVASSRYVIGRYSGCQTTYSDSWLVIVLFAMWPLIWSIVAFVLSILTIAKYLQRRKDVRDILRTTNSGLNLRRFARLLIFCIMIVLVMLPLSVYLFATEVVRDTALFDWSTFHLSPYWDYIYFLDEGVVYDRWINCALSYLAFLVFGLGHDAIQMYQGMFRYIGFGPLIDHLDKCYQRKKQSIVNTIIPQDQLSVNTSLKDEQETFDTGSYSNTPKIKYLVELYNDDKKQMSYQILESLNGELSSIGVDEEQYLQNLLLNEEDDDDMGGKIVYLINDKADIC